MISDRQRVKIFLSVTGCFVAVILLAIGWIYGNLALPTYELNHQLRAMVQNHDVTEMKTLSYDDATYKYLVSLPKNVSIEGSDFQGGGSPRKGVIIGYFPAMVGRQSIACYMVEPTHTLFPRWKLVKIAENSATVGIDPNWAN